MTYTDNTWKWVVNGWLIEKSVIDCQYERTRGRQTVEWFQEYKDTEKQNVEKESCKKNAVVMEPLQTWKITYWEREYYSKFCTAHPKISICTNFSR